ncbi:MAG: acyl-CoA dehydrogenase family protein [Polyangiales bacterium]
MDMQANVSVVAKARSIGPRLAELSVLADRSGDFVAESYRILKEQRLFSAAIPEELGGGGASYEELCEMLRVMAHACPSTSLALSMHTHLVAVAVWRHRHGQPAAELLKKIASDELVLVSTGAGDWLESQGRAVRVEGGYVVNARKRFASGSPAGDLTMTSAPYDDPEKGPEVLHFALPLRGPGVRVGDDWDTLGMRATGSHTVTFEDVFVPDSAITARRTRGTWHPMFSLICTVALPLIVSTYLGIGEKASELAIEPAKRKASDPTVVFAIGEMERALLVARMAWRELVEGVQDYEVVPTVEIASGALARKAIAAESLERCVKKAVEAVGGAAFYRSNPLERLWRDIQAVHFHPLPDKKQLELGGRVALGLSPA